MSCLAAQNCEHLRNDRGTGRLAEALPRVTATVGCTADTEVRRQLDSAPDQNETAAEKSSDWNCDILLNWRGCAVGCNSSASRSTRRGLRVSRKIVACGNRTQLFQVEYRDGAIVDIDNIILLELSQHSLQRLPRNAAEAGKFVVGNGNFDQLGISAVHKG